MVIILLIIAFVGTIFFEVPGLIRKKYWRDLFVFMFFLSAVFMLTFLQIIGVKFPLPTILVDFLVKDLLHLNYR